MQLYENEHILYAGAQINCTGFLLLRNKGFLFWGMNCIATMNL